MRRKSQLSTSGHYKCRQKYTKKREHVAEKEPTRKQPLLPDGPLESVFLLFALVCLENQQRGHQYISIVYAEKVNALSPLFFIIILFFFRAYVFVKLLTEVEQE